MAVNTTVQVTMPQMGDSVSEGTVLEWHKQEGDQVSADEVLVEISTDKVDAEVQAPAPGTVVKLHAAEDDTVSVGAVLAEVAANGSGPAAVEAAAEGGGAVLAETAPSGSGRAAVEPPAEEDGAGPTIDIERPAMGESVTEGTILEWAKQPGETVKEAETIVEVSTDKVDAEIPAPASGT